MAELHPRDKKTSNLELPSRELQLTFLSIHLEAWMSFLSLDGSIGLNAFQQ